MDAAVFSRLFVFRVAQILLPTQEAPPTTPHVAPKLLTPPQTAAILANQEEPQRSAVYDDGSKICCGPFFPYCYIYYKYRVCLTVYDNAVLPCLIKILWRLTSCRVRLRLYVLVE